jgi:cold shock protein
MPDTPKKSDLSWGRDKSYLILRFRTLTLQFSHHGRLWFYQRDAGGDVFVHFNSIVGEGFKNLTEGQRVEFTVEQGQKGPAAVEVTAI